MAPEVIKKIIVGWMVYNVTPIVKEIYPQFVSGLGFEEMGKHVYSSINHQLTEYSKRVIDPVVIDIDGSSHDAHRKEGNKHFDEVFWKLMTEYYRIYLDLEGVDYIVEAILETNHTVHSYLK